MAKLSRIEIWDDLEANGGVRKAVVRDLFGAVEERRIDGGEQTLSVQFSPLEVAVVEAIESRVVRTVFVDGTFDEWRITDLERIRQSDALAATLVASWPEIDLATKAAIIDRTDTDGRVDHDIEPGALTIAQHWTTFLEPALVAAGLTFYDLGTVDSTVPVELFYRWANVRQAAQQLAQLTETEFQLRRVGVTNYYLDFLTRIGSSAPALDVRLGKNLAAVTRKGSGIEQATVVYPRGADEDGWYATMALAEWEVTNVASLVITLADPLGGAGPIGFDDQLNGFYFRKVDGTLTLITDSDATNQTVTVSSATGIATNDRIQFRKDSSGTHLTYLQHPVNLAAWGRHVAIIERSGIPSTVNLVANPAMRVWTGLTTDPPDNWTKLGTPTLTQTTAKQWWLTGNQSCRVQAAADGDGIRTDYVNIYPTAIQPYFSGFMRFWLVAGKVRLIFEATDGVTTWTWDQQIPSALATSTLLNVWDALGYANWDLNALGATQVRLHLVQDGATAAEFYVDAAQITQTVGQRDFIEGSGGTALWQAANVYLAEKAGEQISYTVNLLDLERLDNLVWPDEQVVLGGDVNVTDLDMGFIVSTRILSVTRDLLEDTATQVILSSKPSDLTETLLPPITVNRQQPPGPRIDPTPVPCPTITLSEVTMGTYWKPIGGIAVNYTPPSEPNFSHMIYQVRMRPQGTTIWSATVGVLGTNTGSDFIQADYRNEVEITPITVNYVGVTNICTPKSIITSGTHLAELLNPTGTGPMTSSDIIGYPDHINYGFSFDNDAIRVRIFSEEHTTDPGNVSSIANKTQTLFTERAGVTNDVFSIDIPIAAQSHYLVTTLVPYDRYDHEGVILTFKTQGAAASPPSPPYNIANVSVPTSGATAPQYVVNTVTPPDGVNKIRTYRNGQIYGADIGPQTADVAVQISHPAISGQTDSWQYVMVTSGGVESTKAPVPALVTVTPTLKLPAVSDLDMARIPLTTKTVTHQWTYSLPAGVSEPTWDYYEASGTSYPGSTTFWANIGQRASHTYQRDLPAPNPPGTLIHYCQIVAKLRGWTDSDKSNLASVNAQGVP